MTQHERYENGIMVGAWFETSPPEEPIEPMSLDALALDAATASVQAATTIAGLRAAVLDLAAAINPTP